MNNANMPKGRGMVKWQAFASMPEQFVGIREMIKENSKMSRPIVTQDAQERIENRLLTSLLAEEEVRITYYDNGYIYTNYSTVVDIDPLEKVVICTDAFHCKCTFKFIDIIDVE
ncbi:3-oxoacyl-ACP synthase [Bacillus toyonensis]|uniref:YolD-like family protein n=1 Tax=Bacillus toyonensis TaxID=155322 RepID=UPI000BF9976D|nr:YolD-like family protein [Bacillus toyonensis]PGB24815.1 3-oxoacyl-ACP synthase [Bacillus toyonensis]PGB31191.1 3-oxoacyl-ACP synthase [Bacillus toyonensis]PHF12411.1 3-oxoacyl-ACP synthase [Bacillus toyonensis]PHF36434.1 3-oxoacyl-ACP synthase [Bacillus toyonensis]